MRSVRSFVIESSRDETGLLRISFFENVCVVCVRRHSGVTFIRVLGMVPVCSQCVTNMESVLTPKKRIQRNDGHVLMRGDNTLHAGGHRFKSGIAQSYLLDVKTHTHFRD
jgi:hypothetical protein